MENVRPWCFEHAFPLQGAAGFDRLREGISEALTHDGRPAEVPFRRGRLFVRQIHFISCTQLLGFADARAWADHALAFLTEKFWIAGDRGWVRRTTFGGTLLNLALDLYDTVFILFALAWRERAACDGSGRRHLEPILDLLKRLLCHPGGHGFCDEITQQSWRQQNPHMCQVGACLDGVKTEENPRVTALADEINSLFLRHFFDQQTQTLGELSADERTRAPATESRIVDLGHQSEWARILSEARELLGRTSMTSSATSSSSPRNTEAIPAAAPPSTRCATMVPSSIVVCASGPTPSASRPSSPRTRPSAATPDDRSSRAHRFCGRCTSQRICWGARAAPTQLTACRPRRPFRQSASITCSSPLARRCALKWRWPPTSASKEA